MYASVVLFCGVAWLLPASARAGSPVTFDQKDGRLQIQFDGKPFATYVWEDPNILRPYFAHIHAPNGKQVTRSHPPVEGQDATDHGEMHPGIWLAFGDLGGADFWRNRGAVEQVEFIEKPKAADGGGGFTVRNRYASGGKTLCEEVCQIKITMIPGGYLLDWTSEFTGPEDFSFGDQEEMGLGVRITTPLTVENGGQILNGDGAKNEQQVWGKQSDWCDYGGVIDGQPVGVTLMPDPKNFRRSWFHARDYGVLVANPFGQNAFTKGETSEVVVRKGETFRLRFGIFVHSGEVDVAAAYRAWLAELRSEPRVTDVTALLQQVVAQDSAGQEDAAEALRNIAQRDPQNRKLANAIFALMGSRERELRRLGSDLLIIIAEKQSPHVDATVIQVAEFLDDTGGERRCEIISDLGALGKVSEVAGPILRKLADPDLNDAFCSTRAAAALCRIFPDDEAALETLIARLGDPKPQARWMAAYGLGTLGEPASSAEGKLVQALDDANPVVRVFAAQALWQANGRAQEIMPVLVRALAEEDSSAPTTPRSPLDASVPTHRAVALSCLGKLGESASEAVPHIAPLVAHEDPSIRFAAVIAIGRIGPMARHGAEAVRGALKDEIPEIRLAAKEALRKMEFPVDLRRPSD